MAIDRHGEGGRNLEAFCLEKMAEVCVCLCARDLTIRTLYGHATAPLCALMPAAPTVALGASALTRQSLSSIPTIWTLLLF